MCAFSEKRQKFSLLRLPGFGGHEKPEDQQEWCGANKRSSEWLKYYSSEFNSFEIDENIECPKSINLARCSSGVKMGGGREDEPRAAAAANRRFYLS